MALPICIEIPELPDPLAITQLSLPYTIIDIIDLVLDTLKQARSQLLHLQQQMVQITGAIDRATELEDTGLMAITSCARVVVSRGVPTCYEARMGSPFGNIEVRAARENNLENISLDIPVGRSPSSPACIGLLDRMVDNGSTVKVCRQNW